MKKLKSILLIDDDAICSWMNKVLLEDMQIAHTIECIEDGTSAIDYLYQACDKAAAHKCPDLIFLDLDMPGTDGFKVLDTLLNGQECLASATSRIIVLTTSMNRKDLERAKQYSVFGYLVKPLTETKVKGMISNYLAHMTQGKPSSFSTDHDIFTADRQAAKLDSDFLQTDTEDIKQQED